MDADGCVIAALSLVVWSGSVALPTVIPPVMASGLGRVLSRRLQWKHRKSASGPVKHRHVEPTTVLRQALSGPRRR